jgi:hypothetical protein
VQQEKQLDGKFVGMNHIEIVVCWILFGVQLHVLIDWYVIQNAWSNDHMKMDALLSELAHDFEIHLTDGIAYHISHTHT